jgi:hypothetical protein
VNVLLGLVLLVSSITQVLAVMNKRADANVGARPINLSDATSLLAASDPQPYMFGASRGASKGGSASNPSTPRQTSASGSFMSGVLGGGNNNNNSDGASFGTFNSKEMFAEV